MVHPQVYTHGPPHENACRPWTPASTGSAPPGHAIRGPGGRRGHAAPARDRAQSQTLYYHPSFPDLPASVPLTYTLSMHACLSERPTERPTFEQAATLLRDVAVEVAEGRYVNSIARVQVPPPLPAVCAHALPCI